MKKKKKEKRKKEKKEKKNNNTKTGILQLELNLLCTTYHDEITVIICSYKPEFIQRRTVEKNCPY